MRNETVRLKDACRDPARFFRSPDDVVEASGLNRDQKLKVLRHWEFDCRELLVAEEESMRGGEPAPLGRVLRAMARVRSHAEDPAG
jgi:hypothetical protein